MRTNRRLSKFILIVSACSIIGSAIVQTAAQNPGQQSPKPPAQQKADPSKNPAPQSEAKSKPRLQEREDESIIIDTELVQLDVTVIDQFNSPIFNLNKNNFDVYEDKVKQVVSSVVREEVPLSIGFVIDTSGSMRSKIETVSEATISLVKQMQTDDEAFVSQFKTESEVVQDFTRDKNKLEKAINELFTTGGTALLDAIIDTSNYARKKGRQRRKALIVISDGLEKNSSAREKEVIEALREAEVQLYFIGFCHEDGSRGVVGNSSNKNARDLLIRLADDSGGRAFFPKDVEAMPAIAAQIGKDLRTQYVVSYYSSNEKRDGSFRSVRVAIHTNTNHKFIARTRQGYYAKSEKTASQ